MADEHPPEDRSSRSSDESNLDAASEDDLDALLAEASVLASEVGADLGVAEEDHEPPGPLISKGARGIGRLQPAEIEPADEDPPGDDVDSKLAVIDELIEQTQQQVGVTADEEPQTPESAAGSAFVPEFMDEFTRPAPEADEPAEEPRPGPEAGSRVHESPEDVDSRVDLKAQSVDSAQDRVLPSMADHVPFHDLPAAVDPDECEADATEPVRVAPVRHRRPSRLFERAANVGLAGVRVLEALDRPFGWLGGPARTALGWVAVATFFTSVIVLLLSLI